MVSSSNEKLLGNKVVGRRPKISHRKWTEKEDKSLISALMAMCDLGWKRENGTFRNGYTFRLEKELKSTLPGSNIKASPHIESRLKLLKRQYDAIIDLKGASGMQWNRNECTVTCLDNDVWDDWVKSHPFAKGLRNKSFPYYEDLHCVFGNRDKRKGLKKSSGSEVQNGNFADVVVDAEPISRQKMMDHEESENEMAEYSDENEDNESKANVVPIPLSWRPNPSSTEEAEDMVGGECPNDTNNVSRDAARKPETLDQDGALPARTASKNDLVSDLEEVKKSFGSFLQKHIEHLSSLAGMIGKEVSSSDKTVAEKRTGLIEELRKLSNLNLRSRLRVATMIVGDPARLDLFYSLSENEREMWVSMLLSGYI